MNIALDSNEIDLFSRYLVELQEWNKKINITSITKAEDIIIKHFLDSLTVFQYIDVYGCVVDIGSGGGFPGIPLKIKKPSLNMLLIEAKRKKANFLRHTIRTLNLNGIDVYNGRAEDFNKKNCFDFAISRAFTDLYSFCNIAAPLVKPGGHIIAMKGRGNEKETINAAFQDLGITMLNTTCFSLPLNKGTRTIIIFQKCFT
ncbi:MAG: 16S rRNA (guanine(527)-N(7))-methyltransferase RsmG [Pseudomonadota bacterium]